MLFENLVDRRQCQRSAFDGPLTVKIDSDPNHTAYTVRAVDISPSGAKLRTSVELKTGQQLTVIRENGITQTIPSQVVWAAANDTRQSQMVGVVFLKPMQV
jgi:hypothetical protein